MKICWTILFYKVKLSMEPRKQIITIYSNTVSPLIESAVGMLLDSSNVTTASKPNVIHATSYHIKMKETILSTWQATRRKTTLCYCSCAIQHITWYVHTLLAYYSRVSRETSWVTHLQMSSLNWIVLYTMCHVF